VNSEPINRGHDDESVQRGTFTYEDLRLENCRVGRDPLIQLTCTSPNPDQAGHFRQLIITNSLSRGGKVVDLGGGPRNDKLQNPVAYYFHDRGGEGRVTKVVSAKFSDGMSDAAYRAVEGFTGKDVRTAEVSNVPFPTLLEPVDDLPPATMITSVQKVRGKLLVSGVSQDNGDINSVMINGSRAQISSSHAGVADWQATISVPPEGKLVARASDRAGNVERVGHEMKLRF